MTQMTAPTTDRRKFLALGSAGALVALAGCGAFRDTEGTPGTSDPPDGRRPGHPPEDPLRQNRDDDSDGSDDGGDENSTSESSG